MNGISLKSLAFKAAVEFTYMANESIQPPPNFASNIILNMSCELLRGIFPQFSISKKHIFHLSAYEAVVALTRTQIYTPSVSAEPPQSGENLKFQIEKSRANEREKRSAKLLCYAVSAAESKQFFPLPFALSYPRCSFHCHRILRPKTERKREKSHHHIISRRHFNAPSSYQRV